MTARLSPDLAGGHYADKQLFSKARLIAWSHRRRFQTALDLASRHRMARLLDYGCGDGTFLAMLLAGPGAPGSAVGFDLSDTALAECRTRLGHLPSLSFVGADDLRSPAHDGRYDGLVCMEVLEHVVEPEAVLADFERLLAPGGRVLISVPVETGLPILVKQSVRRVAGWFGIGDYPGTSPYTAAQLLRAVFAGEAPHLERPVFRHPGGEPWHDHKGFNWQTLRARLARRFDVEATMSSPFLWLPPHLGTQAWFVARRRG
jgi:SAM-dependent methyltransferase